MEVSIKIRFFWCIMSCNLIDRYHYFHWTSCLHSEHRKLSKWNQQVSVKFWYLSIPMMSVTTRSFVHLFNPAAPLCHFPIMDIITSCISNDRTVAIYINIWCAVPDNRVWPRDIPDPAGLPPHRFLSTYML